MGCDPGSGSPSPIHPSPTSFGGQELWDSSRQQTTLEEQTPSRPTYSVTPTLSSRKGPRTCRDTHPPQHRARAALCSTSAWTCIIQHHRLTCPAALLRKRRERAAATPLLCFGRRPTTLHTHATGSALRGAWGWNVAGAFMTNRAQPPGGASPPGPSPVWGAGKRDSTSPQVAWPRCAGVPGVVWTPAPARRPTTAGVGPAGFASAGCPAGRSAGF